VWAVFFDGRFNAILAHNSGLHRHSVSVCRQEA
jgi:hypothetical protein